MLVDLDCVLAVFQVLRIHYVHLELAVTTDAHLSHVLSLVLHGLSQLHLDFVLLPCMIDNEQHDLFFPFDQLVASVDILSDEFLSVS